MLYDKRDFWQSVVHTLFEVLLTEKFESGGKKQLCWACKQLFYHWSSFGKWSDSVLS